MQSDPYAIYRSLFESPAVKSAWMAAYGGRFWNESEPPNSQATADDVAFVIDSLNAGPARLIADFGCGSGCLGRAIAASTRANVAGIDFNPIAVRLAEERAGARGLADRLTFKTGDIAATGWPDHHFDGAASLDVLLFAQDKTAALREIARVLKPGARFAGTTFELRKPSEALSVPAFTDYEAAFVQANLTVETYEETPDWRGLLERALSALIAHEATIRQEVHPAAAERMFTWAHRRGAELDHSRRVRFCVTRP
ncbi:MAG: class I SAM-dependent methyltransferase [Micropepsaceae bacterium]